jgi:hypothetical protein
MRRDIPIICVYLLLTATAVPAFAQQRLFARTDREIVELDPRASSLGTVIRRFSLPGEIYRSERTKDLVSIRGGEFLAWVDYFQSRGPAIVLLNTHSGAVQHFTFPGFNPTRVIGTDGNARLLVLANNSSASNVVLVADARSGVFRFLEVGRLSPFSSQIAYASATDILFVAKPRTLNADSYHDVDVIQASTGTLLKTLDISPVTADVLSTNATGTRLFVTDALNATFVYDVMTGTQSARAASPPLQSTRFVPILDEYRNRLIVHIALGGGAAPEYQAWRGLSAFAADSLALIGNVKLPQLPAPPSTPEYGPALTEEVDVSGLSTTIFVLQSFQELHKYFAGGCYETSQLIALDAGTGQVRQATETSAALGRAACRAHLIRLTEPAPPQGTAEVDGHRVTLKWGAPFGATEYEIEAGSAPRLTDLGRVSVTDLQLVVDDVPPGVYYLRLRALNTIGKSAASKEIQIIVR